MFQIGQKVVVTMPSGVERDGVVIHDPDNRYSQDDDGHPVANPDRVRVKTASGFSSPTRDRVRPA